MKSVLLRLEAPLQSWGTQGRFGVRETDAEPSKSGVLGLVAAAMGMPRDDRAGLARLAGLRMAVRVDREGVLVRDYHTVGAGKFRGADYGLFRAKDPAITERFYLADAAFVVALGSDDHELVERVGSAVQNPRWPLYLGRKACAPSAPVYIGIEDEAPDEAVRRAPWSEARGREQERGRVRLVLEAETGRPRNDVPLSFAMYERHHGRRFVRIDWMDRPKQETTSSEEGETS